MLFDSLESTSNRLVVELINYFLNYFNYFFFGGSIWNNKKLYILVLIFDNSSFFIFILSFLILISADYPLLKLRLSPYFIQILVSAFALKYFLKGKNIKQFGFRTSQLLTLFFNLGFHKPRGQFTTL